MAIAQLDLFGGEPVAAPPRVPGLELCSTFPEPRGEVTDREFYTAVSAVQKCVRRNLPDLAVKMASFVYRRDKSTLRRRLGTMLTEDIGLGDLDILRRFGPRLLAGRLTWAEFETCTRGLCAAIKNRDGDDPSWAIVVPMQGGKLPPMEMFGDPAELHLLAEKFSPADWSWVEAFAASNGPRCTETVRLIRSLAAMSQVHSYVVAILACHRWDVERDALSAPLGIHEDPRCQVDFGLIDGFPDCAIDGHTRAGKAVYTRLSRIHQIPDGALHAYVFFNDGARLDRWAYWANDYRTILPRLHPKTTTIGRALDNMRNERARAFRTLG